MCPRITDPNIVKKLVNEGRLDKSVLEAFDRPSKPSTQKNTKATNSKTRGYAEGLLYNLLHPFYKDYWSNGELIRELRAIPNRGFLIDVAMPNYKIALEVDGITGHAMLPNGQLNLEGFKRDREKWLLLASEGWQVISCMTSQIKSQPGLILDAVETALKYRERRTMNIQHPSHLVAPYVIHD